MVMHVPMHYLVVLHASSPMFKTNYISTLRSYIEIQYDFKKE